MSTNKSGGAAMAGGQRYQAQVTAWWEARILLATPVGILFDLPASAVAERVYSETTDEVDDVRIALTHDSLIFGQCKRTLNLSTDPESGFSSVLAQFYRELELAPSDSKARRMAAFYERNNSRLEKLKLILERFRTLPHGSALTDATFNKEERSIVTDLNSLLDELELAAGFENLAARRDELLRSIYLHQLKLSSGDSALIAVEDSLRFGLLENPTQLNVVMTSLHRLADDLMADRRSMDRAALRQFLLNQGIKLRESADFHEDFRRLDEWSATALTTHEAEGRITLTVGGHKETISRLVVDTMAEAVQDQSFLVVGDAGSGKTGCLMAVARRLREAGNRVWYWATDSLPYHSVQEIGAQLKLEHPWAGIFAEARSASGTVLILDGLDGLRDSHAQRAYRDLINLALRYEIRVVASIRSFDLRYAGALQHAFPGQLEPIDARFAIEEFRRINHVAVLDATDEELTQATTFFPELDTALSQVPQLIPVVRNLFSLDLLCKLIGEGVSTTQLSSIYTQAELFEMYWGKKVTAHELREEMEIALTTLIEQMIREQTLRVLPVAGTLSGSAAVALFSAGIIRHPPTSPGWLPSLENVEFSHHLLFDYAAERLFVRPRRKQLAAELLSADSWALFLRPSLILFFVHAWTYGRQEFWNITIELARASVPVLQRMIPYLVVAGETKSLNDLRPLLDGGNTENDDRINWVRTAHGVVAVGSYSAFPKTFRNGSGEWWLEFANELIVTGYRPLVYVGHHLLQIAAETIRGLSSSGLSQFNQAALAVVKFQLENEPAESPNVRPAIRWMCLSIAADPAGTSEVIRSLITPEALHRAGYIYAYEIANTIQSIWTSEPSLAVEIYNSVFEYVETDRSATSVSGSLIMSLTSNRQQDYEMAYYVLGEALPAFLVDQPSHATRAIIKAVKHLQDREGKSQEKVIDTFRWNGRDCRISDRQTYGFGFIYRRDDQRDLLDKWQHYLEGLSSKVDGPQIWEQVSEVVADENESATVWERLLRAGARAPEFYAARLWTILTNPVILVGTATREASEECIAAFSSHLNHEETESIEATILGLGPENFPTWGEESIQVSLPRIKARLLLCFPEENRGEKAREFLKQCDPQILVARESVTPSREFMARDFEEQIRWPNYQKILHAANSLRLPEGGEVTDENVELLLATSRDVQEQLETTRGGMDSELIDVIERRLTEVYSRIACSQVNIDDSLHGIMVQRFKGVLASPSEPPAEDRLTRFDSQQYWDPTDERINATEGFVCLAAKAADLSSEDKDLLHRLTKDPEPRIPYHLGRRIWSFLDRWDDFVWETLERWTAELVSKPGIIGVLQGTFRSGWFWWLRQRDEVRADKFLQSLSDASRKRNASELRDSCGRWFVLLYLVKNVEWAHQVLNDWIAKPEENLLELRGGLIIALDIVLPQDQSEEESFEHAPRATEFIVQVLKSSITVISAYVAHANTAGGEANSEGIPESVKSMARLFDVVATRFRFAAEAQAKRCAAAGPEEVNRLMIGWWETLEPVLEALLSLPHPAFIYHLMEGLEHLLDYDAARSLHWLRRATVASAPEGLTTESLAADKAIAILEKILGDHRASLAVGTELRSDFISTLEAYLQQGWPRALILASKLEGIYR